MSKKSEFHDRAVSIYEHPCGDTPPFREGIIARVERELEDAYARGRIAGVNEARESCLRESLAIARGFLQDVASRERSLDLELRDLLKKLGKVTT